MVTSVRAVFALEPAVDDQVAVMRAADDSRAVTSVEAAGDQVTATK
jgi:hypothetical protein